MGLTCVVILHIVPVNCLHVLASVQFNGHDTSINIMYNYQATCMHI